MNFLLTVQTCEQAAPRNFKHDLEKKKKTYKKCEDDYIPYVEKMLDYVKISTLS